MYWSYCLGCRSIWATLACQDSFVPASHSWPRMPRWCLSTLAHRAVGTSCWSLMKPYTILPGPWCCLNALLYHFDSNIFNIFNIFDTFKVLNWYHGYMNMLMDFTWIYLITIFLLSLVFLTTWCISTCPNAKVSPRWASLCGRCRQSSFGQCRERGPRFTEKRKPGTGHGQLLDVPCQYWDI